MVCASEGITHRMNALQAPDRLKADMQTWMGQSTHAFRNHYYAWNARLRNSQAT